MAAPQTIGMDHHALRFLGPPVSMLPSTFWTNNRMVGHSGGPFKLSFNSDSRIVEFLMSGGRQIAELLVDGRRVQLAGSGKIETDASGSPYTFSIDWLEPGQHKYEIAGINLLLRGINLSPGASLSYPNEDDTRPLLIVIGDSLVLGVGAESYGRSAPAVMARALGFEYWGDGLGGAGWTSSAKDESVVARMEAGAFAVAARDGSGCEHERLTPPVIAAFLGRNDGGASVGSIGSAWTRWYEIARAHYGREIAILTFGPWIVGDSAGDLRSVDEALRATVEAMRIAGDERIAYFSIADATMSRAVSEVVFQDASHPNDLGHELIGIQAAARGERFVRGVLPTARLCLPDRQATRTDVAIRILLTLENDISQTASCEAIATGSSVVFDPWSALDLVEKIDRERLTVDATPIFHAADGASFRRFCGNIGVMWLRRRAKVVIATTQRFVAMLADPAHDDAAEVMGEVNALKEAGVPVGWALIDARGDARDLARALREHGTPEPRESPIRLPTFGSVGVEDAARGIAAALPLFHAQFRPQEMCADDCMMTGETFARLVCGPGFQSHLWGTLARRLPVTRSGRGILYIAYGTKYFRIAEYSAISLKRHNPNMRVAIVTNEIEQSPVFDFQIAAPGAENVIEEYFRRTDRMESMKFIAFPFSPFAETLFLDCDTLVTGYIADIFDRFRADDIVLTNESRVALGVDALPIQKTLDFTDPMSFNAGVFLFRDTPAAERYLTAWWAWFLWDQAGPSRIIGNWGTTGVSDQSVLHLMAWANFHDSIGVKLSIAPNVVYNATDRIWALLHKSGRWDEAKVLHSKLPYFLRNTKKAEALWDDAWPQSWL